MTADAQSPVSFMFQVNRLPKNGADVTLEADEAQRAELARIHDLLSVEAFTAELSVKKWKADGVMVKGRVRARITQQCVVTLDPILSHIDEEITAIFVPETSKLARHLDETEIILDPEAEDLPETYSGDSIDLGALAEEFFTLGIDPYPRKEGITLEEALGGEVEEKRGPLYEQLKKLGGGN